MKSKNDLLNDFDHAGEYCYNIIKELFPLCRSITGNELRNTLLYFQSILPEMIIESVPSGYSALDWTVPFEWNIQEAYIEDAENNRVVDFKLNNLHVVGYSIPVDEWLSLEELQSHLHSLPAQPNAIPYVTSYYKENWGFCIAQEQRDKLDSENYHCVIKSELAPGELNYGELLIPGETDREILLSTYVCHPSMANNELSGPAVACALALWIKSLKKRKYSYRIVFIPETIGSLVYLSKNIDVMKEKVVSGFVLTCVGDDRCYSYLPSRAGNTLADRVALKALGEIDPDFIRYTWLDRGSDERQYCAPGIDLPVALVMRSKFYEYPEYHTSLDNLDFVSPDGLQGGFNALRRCISILEANVVPRIEILGEPQLGKRGLYPSFSTRDTFDVVKCMMGAISYCDGTMDLLAISEKIGRSFQEVSDALRPLIEAKIITVTEPFPPSY